MPTGRSSAKKGQAGTAALETMVVMSFLFTLIFGFVHICMFIVKLNAKEGTPAIICCNKRTA